MVSYSLNMKLPIMPSYLNTLFGKIHAWLHGKVLFPSPILTLILVGILTGIFLSNDVNPIVVTMESLAIENFS